MKITDYITKIFKRKDALLRSSVALPSWSWSLYEKTMPFGDLIWQNIIELLCDICNDVDFKRIDGNMMLFAQFKRFFEQNGERVLLRLFDFGAVAIGHDINGFRLLENSEIHQTTLGGKTYIEPSADGLDVYVMKSQIFDLKGLSDRQICYPYIKFIDNVMNASNTCSARLGNLVVGSPSQSSAMPTSVVLTEKDKKAMEKEIGEEYGALANQKQFLLLPRAMNFSTINLASVDMRTTEKAKLAILAICDRIKVPANQVGIVDASSSKSFANGSELREGDFNKYQSFERLLNKTFIKMANEIGLKIDYTIYNKPTRQNITN